MSKASHSPNDLIEFENQNRNSSFGKKLLSTVPNVPAFGFGTSSRYQASQVYRENRLMEKGKHSPGPIYNPIKNYYQQAARAPSAGMGTSTRQSLNTNHYDHYKRKDVDFEPQKAEPLRKWSAGTVRIGQEQRFLLKELTKTPGPNYDVTQKIQGPKYTMGNRRAHSVSFSTPNQIGPGTYKPKKDFSTELQEPPKYSFTKAPKIPQQKNIDKNQTYYVQESIGAQVASTKPNKPAFSFGKGIREAKLAMYYIRKTYLNVSFSLQIRCKFNKYQYKIMKIIKQRFSQKNKFVYLTQFNLIYNYFYQYLITAYCVSFQIINLFQYPNLYFIANQPFQHLFKYYFNKTRFIKFGQQNRIQKLRIQYKHDFVKIGVNIKIAHPKF